MLQAIMINLQRERNRYRSVKEFAEKSRGAVSTISDILYENSCLALEVMAQLEVGRGLRL